MKIPTQDELKEKTRGKIPKSGLSCSFFPINRKIGVKLFHSEERARRCYRLHTFYTRNDSTRHYVPEVYGKLFKHGNQWGYFVQRCTVAINSKRLLIGDEFAEMKKELLVAGQIKMPRLSNWVKHLFSDDHEDNYGFLGKQLVWLDFSIGE